MPDDQTIDRRGTTEAPLKANDKALRVVMITLDNHLATTQARAAHRLLDDGIHLSLHAATDWARRPETLQQTKAAIASADIILVTMLFLEDHISPILPDLAARRYKCMALVAVMSAGEIINLTRMGKLEMGGEAKGALALIRRLRGSKKKQQSSGAGQMAMLKRLPKLLRFIPGTAQDLRAYFQTMLYWLSASDTNVTNMVRNLVNRYAAGSHKHLRGALSVEEAEIFPDTGLYHPDLKGRFTDSLEDLPRPKMNKGTIGLLLMRSYLLARDTAHYDAVIRAFEARGYAVVPAFASGLDSRPAVDAFFTQDGATTIDSLVSLTGFSLVGGPAYNDSKGAIACLTALDVPYIAAHALEFQSLDQWQASDTGLMPIETTMMVAIPELDGATGPLVFGGRRPDLNTDPGSQINAAQMHPAYDRVDMLVSRVTELINNRKKQAKERKVAIILYNFPPGAGSVGSAAFLDVFRSLYNTLERLKAEGYRVSLPKGAADLKEQILGGNTAKYGTPANVVAKISTDDFIAREPYLEDIEAQWGPAPGKQLSFGRDILIQGIDLGHVFVGIQPGLGIEGDPMKLLFDKGFAPTHAFSAFYRYIREDFGADVALHFGTHGALEFMPGAQVGMTGACWPDRLIGSLPHIYLYAANNPSEGTLAKRRSAATLVSHLTPSVTEAGLYNEIADLKESLNRYRTANLDGAQKETMRALIQDQAAKLDLAPSQETPAKETPAKEMMDDNAIEALYGKLISFEEARIPHGLHVVGETLNPGAKRDLLTLLAQDHHGLSPKDAKDLAASVVADAAHRRAPDDGSAKDTRHVKDTRHALEEIAELLSADGEMTGLLRALEGRFIAPVAGGDLIRTTDILPTGRNLHGFDPFRLPSQFALKEGAAHADLLLETYRQKGAPLPTSIAVVLWGTDTIKTEGSPIGQVLRLVGATPRLDSYGRLSGADLIPLEDLGRPRVDVVMTLSGIFRDLMPLQIKMLAEAMLKASLADEPLKLNPIRAHSLAYAKTHGVPMETAALRLFSNAEGAYGSNVNLLLDSGRWDEEDELADTFTARKCFAYGADGAATPHADLMKGILRDVDMTYQNLESIELGVTTIDHYFDTLGGISRAVRQARGTDVPVYIGDQTQGEAKVRTLDEQVELEARTRMLNPKWVEGMLDHGYEGVRQIEAGITNTLGWSATTGQVAPWIYQKLTEQYVLDDEMRQRLADLNPAASVNMTNRLIEAHERSYWQPDAETLDQLLRAGEELEDRLEGVGEGAAA